jgi:hypothetical protein
MDDVTVERQKASIVPAVAVSLFACFMLFFFAPLDTYLTNSNEFWFSLKDLWPSFLIIFLGMFLLMLFVFLLIRRFNMLYKICLAVALGLSLAAYLQGNFLNISTPFLDGNIPDWLYDSSTRLANAAIWFGAVLIILLLAFAIKFTKERFYSIVKVISFAMTAVLAVTVGISAFTAPSQAKQGLEKQYYLSTEDRFELSSDHNIILFWIDSVETTMMDEVLQKNPEYLAGFDGFTYYHNMAGSYRKTAGVYAYLMTGEYYLNEKPFPQFAQEALNNQTLFPKLKEMGYNIHIKEWGQGIPYSEVQMAYFDNLEAAEIKLGPKKPLIKNMLFLTAYRYAPVVLKPIFYDDYTAKLSTDNAAFTFEKPISWNDDVGFYDALRDEKLVIQGEYNCFKFYFLRGAHGPFDINEKTEKVEKDTVTYYEQILGTLNLVNEYFDQMKELGIYDNSTIIVMADHGEGWITAPSFLMKPAEAQGELTISNAPVSHEDIWATIMYAAGGAYESYGKPVMMWEEGDERQRKYYTYAWQKNVGFDYYFEDITEYNVPADANDYDNYSPTGNVYEKP